MAGRRAVACFHLTPPNRGTANTYWALFQMMCASLCRVSPGAEVHLLTLDSCAVPDGLGCDLVFRRPSSRPIEASFDILMAEEAETWCAYQAAGHLDGPTILIDADLLFQLDPFALFDGGFDVGLTYGTDAALHTFNTGVILIDPARADVAQTYLGRIDSLVAGYAPEFQAWYGDQMAISALLGDPEYPPGTDWVMERQADGIRYRLLPAAEWNFALPLDASDQPVFAPATDAGIVHFKGERKAIMARYASDVLGLEIKEDAASPGGWSVKDPAHNK
jgi:hypothetical protein